MLGEIDFCLCAHAELYPSGCRYCNLTAYPNLKLATELCENFTSGVGSIRALKSLLKERNTIVQKIVRRTIPEEKIQRTLTPKAATKPISERQASLF